MAVAAVHQRALPEDVVDRLAGTLCAIQDEQDRLSAIQAALDEIDQQRASVAFSVELQRVAISEALVARDRQLLTVD
jgi:hypothetical protein